MSNVTEQQVVAALVQHIKNDPTEPIGNYVGGYTPDAWKQMYCYQTVNSEQEVIDVMTNPANWELMEVDPECRDNTEEWAFNCEPFDDQLRAYVYVEDGEICFVEVIGE